MFKLRKLYIFSGFLFIFLLITGVIERKNFLIPNQVIWTSKNVNWDNFTKVEKLPNNYVATIYSAIYCPEKLSWFDSKIYAYMNPQESEKLADSMINDDVLIHEQYHFNITEYHTRLLRKDLINIGESNITAEILDSLFDKYYDENERMQIEYDSITNHSVNQEEQRYWELKIDDYFRQTSYYKEIDLLKYFAYQKAHTKHYKKIYRTFNNNVLCSFPISAEEAKNGKSYKVEYKNNEIIVSFYKNGKLKNGGVFNTAITLIELDEQSVETKYLNPDKSLNTELEFCIFKRTIEKNKLTDHYFNSDNERISVNGVYSTVSNKNDNNTVIINFYDKSSRRIKNNLGVYQKVRKLDSLGRTIELEFFDKNNNPVNDNDLVSNIVKEYDSNNLVVSYKEYDKTGEFAEHLYSFNTKFEYDEKGNLLRTINLDKDSKISPNKDGVSIYTYAYDINDNLTSTKKFNRNNQPIQGTNNYHMDIETFDGKDRTTYYGQFYAGNVLTFSEGKWGATKYLYPNDSIIIEKNVDVYGDSFNDNAGVGIIRKILDKKGQISKMTYLNSENNYAQTKNGIVQYQYKYDERGNKIEESAYDSLGNLRAFEEDVAKIKWEYDSNNNKTKTTYYNALNELANAKKNVTYNIYKYNKKNQLIERRNLNKHGKPQLLDSYYKTHIIPNRHGNDSILLDYGTDNKLLDGVCKTVYKYNRFNNEVSVKYFNKNDEPTNNASGFAEIKSLYDNRQRYLGYTYYGANGEKVNSKIGVGTYIQELNEMGYVNNEYYFDKNDAPVEGPDGFHRKKYNWNELGEIIELSYYDRDGKLLEDESGVAKYIYKRSEAGLISSIKRYNRFGHLTNNNTGVSETYYTSYLNGLYYLEKQLDNLGNEIPIE